MTGPDRVLVLGPPGSGKTTLARELAGRTGLPLLDLDDHFWLPGWQRLPDAEWRATQRELAARPRWVISGNYQPTLGVRVPRAQVAVIVAPGRVTVLRRLARRTIRRLRGDAASLPEALRGAPRRQAVRGLWPLVRTVLSYEDVHLPATRALLAEHRVPHVVVRDRSDVDGVYDLLGGAR